MLSRARILQEMAAGRITIAPFTDAQLGTNSYDARLGQYFYKLNPDVRKIDLANPEEVALAWQGPFQVPDSIPIAPYATILAHTVERVGTFRGMVAKMGCRSSVARMALSVCRCAGIGDIGYDNHWTMEISNHSNILYQLPVGMPICQFTFEDAGACDEVYNGNYAHTTWEPWMMLPNARLALG